MKRHTIQSTRCAVLILVGTPVSLLLSDLPGQVQPETGHSQIINLYAVGPQPPQTDMAAGAAVVKPRPQGAIVGTGNALTPKRHDRCVHSDIPSWRRADQSAAMIHEEYL
jgi:hypothetical protein